ncbi:hypothetical protein A2U01_0062510, partial [Trifolium medium]|nr:hypothetical protein [Trifolium medium]
GTKELTARNACCCAASFIRRRGKMRRAVEENTMIERRSEELRFCMTKLIARFSNAIFEPVMLPLMSRTVTRSIGAREVSSEDSTLLLSLFCVLE